MAKTLDCNVMAAGRSNISNAIGGLLAGYGIAAFFCFLVLVEHWAQVAPQQPDPSRGLIFPHNEHGTITYFTGFQGTSCAILFATSIPIGGLGILVLPKKNVVRRIGFLGVSAKWDQDDPRRISNVGFMVGAIIAPVLIFSLGPFLVRWLNGIGFVSGF